jgi:ribosomal protein S7
MNTLMSRGKKPGAERVVWRPDEVRPSPSGSVPAFHEALENEAGCRGPLARSAGATYQAPVEVRPSAARLAIRWIIRARDRSGQA